MHTGRKVSSKKTHKKREFSNKNKDRNDLSHQEFSVSCTNQNGRSKHYCDEEGGACESTKMGITPQKNVNGGVSSALFNSSVREMFLHYLCQVCKEDPLEPTLCKKCKMVTYCGDEHRRRHWPFHMEVCEAIESICKEKNIKHLMQNGVGLTAEEFKNFRFKNMCMCEQILERKLELWEREIFLHPNVCEICYEYDKEKLCRCPNCHHISFCYSHKTNKHDMWCCALMQYRQLVQYHFKYGFIDVSLPDTILSKINLPLSKFQDIFPDTNNSVQFLELTELASGPLTAFHALQVCSEEIASLTTLQLHIIGAESNFETTCLEKWEFFLLHFMKNLKTLKIVFIGPELNMNSNNIKEKHTSCNTCKAHRKYLQFQYIPLFYHDYAKCTSYTAPDIICFFNPGLYRTTGFAGSDTWQMTIETVFSLRKVAIVLTEYTKAESELDIQRVGTMRSVDVIRDPSRNPFSSLKPNLNFITEDEIPVIFKNFYYTLVKLD